MNKYNHIIDMNNNLEEKKLERLPVKPTLRNMKIQECIEFPIEQHLSVNRSISDLKADKIIKDWKFTGKRDYERRVFIVRRVS